MEKGKSTTGKVCDMPEMLVVLDTFTGADGGVSFVKLAGLVNEMRRRAESGDQAASEVIEVVKRFARLIEVSDKG